MTPSDAQPPHPQMRWLFDQLMARRPDDAALIAADGVWTSPTLLTAVEDLAHALIPHACSPGTPVRLAAPRSRPDAVVALLATWQLGLVPVLSETTCAWTHNGATVQPPALQPADATQTLSAAHPTARARIEVLGRPWSLTGDPVPEALPCTQPAYVIATSGTTGPPVPVLNHIDGLRTTLTALVDRYALTPASRALLFAPFGYDAALADLLPVLLAGGAVVCCEDGSWQRPSALAARIRDAGVTHVVLPPSVLRRVAPALAAAHVHLDVLVSAGEPLHTAQADQLIPIASRVVNAYGPSEAAICTTTFNVPPIVGVGEPSASALVAVGQPLPRVVVEVVDDAGNPVGHGTFGRVIVRGPTVAHGYLEPVTTTARLDRFKPAGPATGQCPPQMLDTGDLGMLGENGDLTLAGRSDDETKLHGRRIRLTAVEATICALPDVADAAVAVHADRLGCVWVPADDASLARIPADIAKLPSPMPSLWQPVAALPVTASDKIDRIAVRRQLAVLAEPTTADAGPATTAPHNNAPEKDIDDALANVGAVVDRLWRRHTTFSPGAPTEHFFAAGGDSLRAMEMLDDVETETGRYIDLADFLEVPTFTHLVTLLANGISASREER